MKHFRKTLITILLLGLLVVTESSYSAGKSTPQENDQAMAEFHRAHLKGAASGVEVIIEDIEPSERAKLGITMQEIRQDIELSLRRSGIKILTRDERMKLPGRPYFYVRVSAVFPKGLPEIAAFTVRAEMAEVAFLDRDPSHACYSTLWTAESLHFGKIDPALIRKIVVDQVDTFTNDYLAVNPR